MDKISFNGKLHFLQNQSGLVCAICGRKMLSEGDIKPLRHSIEHLKGQELAQKLSSYVDYYGEKCSVSPLLQLIELAKNPQNALAGIKNLALMLKEGRIHSSDYNMLLHNLFDTILYSADHVVPRSQGGINSYSNFIPAHRGCNTDRSSSCYRDLVVSKPEIIENLKKAISLVQSRIKSDKAGLSNYKISIPEDYSVKVTEALASQGIDPKLISLA